MRCAFPAGPSGSVPRDDHPTVCSLYGNQLCRAVRPGDQGESIGESCRKPNDTSVVVPLWTDPAKLIRSVAKGPFGVVAMVVAPSRVVGLTLVLWTPELAGSGDLGERCWYDEEAKVHAGVSDGGSSAGDRHGSQCC